ncbi:MAG: dethiobiotin synthase [Candidatus Omnitrophica bacterium CG23_combo_of_CG06-09_8_20_14_all_40_11]|nr:MAG: dethiobiotin synthase [Candidatus Omnitrophica bacterium CG23_combo_of_CG06-09_8_20_14_all_40_11]
MKGIFVTGTDTGVGKTIITGLLGRYLSDKGYNVITQKWIQTGCRDSLASDIKLHLKIMGRDKNDLKDYAGSVSPYTFRVPSSPHLASLIENKIINPNKIIKSFKLLSRRFDFIIAEGVGGVLVPFNKKRLVIDIVRDLDLAVLVVAQNKLGAINHTLLTIEALEKRKIKILGIIFNNLKKENSRIIEDNPLIIKALTNQRIFGVLPWIETHVKLYKSFIPIGEQITKELTDG